MNTALKITALSTKDFVKIMQASGCKNASEELLQKDIESGAPVNPDGTINLVKFASWLMLERRK